MAVPVYVINITAYPNLNAVRDLTYELICKDCVGGFGRHDRLCQKAILDMRCRLNTYQPGYNHTNSRHCSASTEDMTWFA
jgi:hypothetical protein